jgi:predicted kinase/REP element-mobilizing transposase RayT
MVLGYHFIFSAYGFWLPNDPRGSWSDTIRVYDLLQFCPATKVSTNKYVAHVPHDRALRMKAQEALRYDPVRFTGIQARAIARGFGIAAEEAGYAIYALAILPDHAHAVLGAHGHHVDRIAAHMKAKATMQLRSEGLRPFIDHPRADGALPSPWARNYWCPFIDSADYLKQAIEYVENNPIRCGLKGTEVALRPQAQLNAHAVLSFLVEAIILCGIQASGKTTFFRERFFNTRVRLSLDLLKTRAREDVLLHACLAAQQPFVVDNTNATAKVRARYLQLAKSAGFKCVLYFFETTTRAAVARNAKRPAKQRVPNIAIFGTQKKLERPTASEGFDAIFTVTLSEKGAYDVKELA